MKRREGRVCQWDGVGQVERSVGGCCKGNGMMVWRGCTVHGYRFSCQCRVEEELAEEGWDGTRGHESGREEALIEGGTGECEWVDIMGLVR